MRLLILTLFAVALAGPAFADDVTASWSPGGGDAFALDVGVEGAAGRGQGFRPTVEGLLRSGTLHLARLGADGATIRVAVHRVDFLGIPISPSLVERTFPIEIVPAGATPVAVDFDLSGAGVFLETDTNYALTIVVTPIAADEALRIAGAVSPNATYSFGMAVGSINGVGWGTSSSIDYAFAVRVGSTVDGHVRSMGAIKGAYRP